MSEKPDNLPATTEGCGCLPGAPGIICPMHRSAIECSGARNVPETRLMWQELDNCLAQGVGPTPPQGKE